MGTTKKLATFFQAFFSSKLQFIQTQFSEQEIYVAGQIRIPMSLAFLAGARDFKQWNIAVFTALL